MPVCCVPQFHQLEDEDERSYNLCSLGDRQDTLENYTLIPVEKTGFVVIKQIIPLEESGYDVSRG